jgi:hypothetical protein
VKNARYMTKFGSPDPSQPGATVISVSTQLAPTPGSDKAHTQLQTFHQYNPDLYRPGYQKFCVVCKMTKSSYFCVTCGPDVPIHNPEGRSQFKHCKRLHSKEPRQRAKKRGLRPDLRTTAPAKKGKRRQLVVHVHV